MKYPLIQYLYIYSVQNRFFLQQADKGIPDSSGIILSQLDQHLRFVADFKYYLYSSIFFKGNLMNCQKCAD